MLSLTIAVTLSWPLTVLAAVGEVIEPVGSSLSRKTVICTAVVLPALS